MLNVYASDKLWLVALSQPLYCWLQRWVIYIWADSRWYLDVHAGICTYARTDFVFQTASRSDKNTICVTAATEIDIKRKGTGELQH